VLREGAYADLNVIDLDNLAMELPEYKHDFPAGAGRFVQRGCGYEQVIVERSGVHGTRLAHRGIGGPDVAQLTNLTCPCGGPHCGPTHPVWSG